MKNTIYKKFSNQKMSFEKHLPIGFIKFFLIVKGNKITVKALRGGGCITNSEYPLVSNNGTEYFSIN